MTEIVRLSGWVGWALLAWGCGGSQPAAAPLEKEPTDSAALAPPPEPPQPVAPVSAPVSSESPPSLSPSDVPAETATEETAAATASETESQRTVKYVVSPEGLRVLADGVAFTPKAEAVKTGAAWSVKVTVEARSDDEGTHSILVPKAGPIAFAGEVRRAGSDQWQGFSDRRSGDEGAEVKPKKPVKVTRTWPPKDGPAPLAEGDELRLELGIWGLGADAASRRPLGKLARVEVKFDKGKPRVKVTAPVGISK